jgi:molybdopterin converting factor small subunit
MSYRHNARFILLKAHMTVTIKVPALWRPLSGGCSRISLQANTVAEALDELIKQYPQLDSQLFNERREVNEALNLFVNQEHIRYRGGLAAPLQDGDEVTIVQVFTGG